MIIKYVNNNGQSVNLNQYPYKMLVSNILDYEPEVLENNGRIMGFGDMVTQREVNIDVHRSRGQSARISLNGLTNIFETDIVSAHPGKLYINDWYIPCYFYGRETDRWETDNIISCVYKVVTDHPLWITEQNFTFLPATGADPESNGLDFPTDFPFDFASSGNKTVHRTVDHYAPSHFQMTVYGPCVDPRITINSYPYQVFATLETGEYLVIDSRENTITKYLNNGTTENLYNSRQFEPSVFEKIPSASLAFDWPGTFGFDVTLFLERSEPKWK